MSEAFDLLSAFESDESGNEPWLSERNPFHEPSRTASPSNWLIDGADLLARPDPGPTPWLVDGLIVAQAIVAAVGRWKTTKSYGLLEMCIAIATGRPAFGKLAIPNPGPVIFVNEESGEAALQRRLDALCRGRGIDPEELRGQLHLSANARIKLDDASWQNDLLDAGREIRPCLFAFDPLARMKEAARKENEQNDMAVLIEFMRYLREETDAAVLFVQHSGHQGDHMRGSSDLESAWESRLAWKRDGQSPLVTIESEHREAESTGTVSYRIDWDSDTRTMRFDLESDPLEQAVRAYLRENPDASANEVNDAVEGTRGKILALVKTIREGGSPASEPPPNHPPAGTSAGGSPAPPFRGAGTTTPEPGTENAEPPLDDELERLALLGEEMGLA